MTGVQTCALPICELMQVVLRLVFVSEMLKQVSETGTSQHDIFVLVFMNGKLLEQVTRNQLLHNFVGAGINALHTCISP